MDDIRQRNHARRIINASRLVVFADGDYIKATASDQPMRFLLISGNPLDEPLVRYGPFVMNTQREIEQALEDLKNGRWEKERQNAQWLRIRRPGVTPPAMFMSCLSTMNT